MVVKGEDEEGQIAEKDGQEKDLEEGREEGVEAEEGIEEIDGTEIEEEIEVIEGTEEIEGIDDQFLGVIDGDQGQEVEGEIEIEIEIKEEAGTLEHSGKRWGLSLKIDQGLEEEEETGTDPFPIKVVDPMINLAERKKEVPAKVNIKKRELTERRVSADLTKIKEM